MEQPKFKFGQKVKTNGGKIFIVEEIRSLDEIYQYYDGIYYLESELTEVKEPMRGEFECRWDERTVGPCLQMVPLAYVDSMGNNPLMQFKGKHTKVTVEEILP